MRSLPFRSCSNCLIYRVVWSQLTLWGVRTRLLKKILNKNAYYVLVEKGNQGRLEQAFDNYFDMSIL